MPILNGSDIIVNNNDKQYNTHIKTLPNSKTTNTIAPKTTNSIKTTKLNALPSSTIFQQTTNPKAETKLDINMTKRKKKHKITTDPKDKCNHSIEQKSK